MEKIGSYYFSYTRYKFCRKDSELRNLQIEQITNDINRMVSIVPVPDAFKHGRIMLSGIIGLYFISILLVLIDSYFSSNESLSFVALCLFIGSMFAHGFILLRKGKVNLFKPKNLAEDPKFIDLVKKSIRSENRKIEKTRKNIVIILNESLLELEFYYINQYEDSYSYNM